MIQPGENKNGLMIQPGKNKNGLMIQPRENMNIKINGDTREVPEGLSVASLLTHLGMNTGRVAVERNLDVLPRARWADTQVAANDSYEIVQLVGGGE